MKAIKEIIGLVTIPKAINHRLREVRKINKKSLADMKVSEERDAFYLKKIKDKFKTIDPEKIEIINQFWKPYEFAYKNNPMTQMILSNLSGTFEPARVPFGLQLRALYRFWNNKTFAVFRNKNYSRLLFPFIKHPVCHVSCSYGNYFDENYNILTKDEAVERIIELLKTRELIIKPSLDSGSGNGIVFIDQNTSKDQLIKHINELSPHFVCQNVLKNHPNFSTGCNALNTMRVATMIYNNKINFVGAIFRMSIGKRVDNFDAGGIICRVYQDGTMGDFGIQKDGTRFERHPNGFEFKGKKLYRAEEIINTALECHKRIPQQKYISWDLTIDENDDIVFLEMNSPGGSEGIQSTGCVSYLNRDIAKEIFDEYIYVTKANFDWNYVERAHYVTLLKYCGIKRKINIPEFVNGKPVKSVSADAFKDSDIKKIYLPEHIEWQREDTEINTCLPNDAVVEIVHGTGKNKDSA